MDLNITTGDGNDYIITMATKSMAIKITIVIQLVSSCVLDAMIIHYLITIWHGKITMIINIVSSCVLDAMIIHYLITIWHGKITMIINIVSSCVLDAMIIHYLITMAW